MRMDQPILELRSITKKYPGVVALDDVSLSFYRGEVHAIVGENGAGKSTFIKVITGAIQPTKGEIWFEGKKLENNNPQKALEMGDLSGIEPPQGSDGGGKHFLQPLYLQTRPD